MQFSLLALASMASFTFHNRMELGMVVVVVVGMVVVVGVVVERMGVVELGQPS